MTEIGEEIKQKKFKSEFQKPAVSFIGENDKPYEVIFDAEKICEGDKKKTVVKDIEPKYLNIVPSSILTIPPSQRSKTIHSSIYANQKICPEIEAKVKIIYAPDYEQLSKEDRMFLEEKDKEFFALLEEEDATDNRNFFLPSPSLTLSVCLNKKTCIWSLH